MLWNYRRARNKGLFLEEEIDMSNAPASKQDDPTAQHSDTKADDKPSAGENEKEAMENAQEKAAEERASERGYQ
jgi:hypothetical protein